MTVLWSLTSVTNSAPTSSSGGRPLLKLSSMIHWRVRLGDDRPLVGDTERLLDELAFRLRGPGRDAVDHGRRERDMGVDPRRQARVLQRGERHQRNACRRGVVGKVVAAEHGERGDTVATTVIECLDQVGPRGGVGVGRGEVSPHLGVVGIELVRDRVQEVPVAGDRQADDAGLGIGQGGSDRHAVVRCVVNRSDRAHHTRRRVVVTALYDGVQPVLSRQQVPGIGGVQADADDTPVRVARACQVVEIDGLVCAVKVARADVDHASLQRRPIVSRHFDTLRVQAESRITERDAVFRTPGDYVAHALPHARCPSA